MNFRILRFALCSCFFAMNFGLWASDHKEAPTIRETAPADIADLYAFINPNDPSKLVLIMTINPFSVPEEAIAFDFSPRVRYSFYIDTDGNTKSNHSIHFRFYSAQTFVSLFPGDRVVEGQVTSPTEEVDANEALITETEDGIRVFAGPRDDPFFFDIVGFFRFLSGTGSFTGTDGFAGYNVSAIVAEVPLAMLGGGTEPLNIWAATERPFQPFKGDDEGAAFDKVFVRQLDRVGNPAVATVLIPPELKDRYNQVGPSLDATEFAPSIVASLQALGTNNENIGILASVAVPDLLTLNPGAPSGFPNGRTPADDVVDTLLFFIFNQTPVGDGVDANDVPFLDHFPFLAPPRQAD